MSEIKITFPGRELVRMGGRKRVRRFWEIDRVDTEGQLPATHALVEVRNGAPELRQFSLTATENGAQIDPSVIRKYDIEGMIEYAAYIEGQNSYMWDSEGTIAPGSSFITEDDLNKAADMGRKMARVRRRIVGPDLLSKVAKIYREADTAPVKAVETHFGKSRRTASWYVKQARAEGYLNDED
jgi:hypothetical protein